MFRGTQEGCGDAHQQASVFFRRAERAAASECSRCGETPADGAVWRAEDSQREGGEEERQHDTTWRRRGCSGNRLHLSDDPHPQHAAPACDPYPLDHESPRQNPTHLRLTRRSREHHRIPFQVRPGTIPLRFTPPCPPSRLLVYFFSFIPPKKNLMSTLGLRTTLSTDPINSKWVLRRWSRICRYNKTKKYGGGKE